MCARPSPQSAPANSRYLRGEAYERILSELLSPNVAPGDRLSVDSLSRRFGISQTPIREALGRLEADGLVTSAHLKGFRASELLSRSDFDALFDARLLLEPFAARSAARCATDEQIAEIVAASEEMSKVSATDTEQSALDHAEADAHLHALVAEAGGNPIVRDTLARMHSHLHVFRLRRAISAIEQSNAEHRILSEALLRRDSHGADAAMRTHVENARDRITAAVWEERF